MCYPRLVITDPTLAPTLGNTMSQTITAKGASGTVTFDGSVVTITRGHLDFAGKGSKTIPLRHITSVQMKRPGLLSAGYLQLTLGGTSEVRHEVHSLLRLDAAKDENTVVFGRKKTREFEALVEAVNAALASA